MIGDTVETGVARLVFNDGHTLAWFLQGEVLDGLYMVREKADHWIWQKTDLKDNSEVPGGPHSVGREYNIPRGKPDPRGFNYSGGKPVGAPGEGDRGVTRYSIAPPLNLSGEPHAYMEPIVSDQGDYYAVNFYDQRDFDTYEENYEAYASLLGYKCPEGVGLALARYTPVWGSGIQKVKVQGAVIDKLSTGWDFNKAVDWANSIKPQFSPISLDLIMNSIGLSRDDYVSSWKRRTKEGFYRHEPAPIVRAEGKIEGPFERGQWYGNPEQPLGGPQVDP
jgi:hypothetical protein